MNLNKITRQAREIAEITGISVGDDADKSTWYFTYEVEPTELQKTQLQELIDGTKIKTKDEKDTDEAARILLLTTDADVLAHLELKGAGLATLTDAEYVALVESRTAARTLLGDS